MIAESAQPPRRPRLLVAAAHGRDLEACVAILGHGGSLPSLAVDFAVLPLAPDAAYDGVILSRAGFHSPEAFVNELALLSVNRGVGAVFGIVAPEQRTEVLIRGAAEFSQALYFLPPVPPGLLPAIDQDIAARIQSCAGAPRRFRPLFADERRLAELLIREGHLTPVLLAQLMLSKGDSGESLESLLLGADLIDADALALAWCGVSGIAVATSRQFTAAEVGVVSLIPEHVASANECVALERKGDALLVAMVDAHDLALQDLLRDVTGLDIVPLLGRREDIRPAIDRFYRNIAATAKSTRIIARVAGDSPERLDVESARNAGSDQAIVRLVDHILEAAIAERASDIHIEAMEHELVVRIRVDGDLRRIMSPPRETHLAILTRIKILANLDIAERRLPQDGRMSVRYNDREIDIRVSVLPATHGEKAVLRIFDKESAVLTIRDLGFTQENAALFEAQIRAPHGIILVTGPTGSGKSTTLYTAIQAIKNEKDNIVTVEDPVEYDIDGVTQVQVNAKIGLTFAAALRSILRQDPDIVLIGEIRDAETADIAIKMALTGHLVFSTLHTNDASSSIARLVDIGVPPLLLSSALNLVIAQRLVRRVCPRCRVEYQPSERLVESAGLGGRGDVRLFRGHGCIYCNNTGYAGRIGIFEMLPAVREIRDLILKGAPAIEIQELAVRQGMRTLRQSGMELALRGETTIEQVIAATSDA